jgi:hypothetical protein
MRRLSVEKLKEKDSLYAGLDQPTEGAFELALNV